MNIAENNRPAPNVLDSSSDTLSQTERLRAMHQTASAIAHEIDIAMAPIARHTDTLLEGESLSERARHDLKLLRRSLDDVAQAVGRLHELYHPREREPLVTRRATAPHVSSRCLRVLLIDDDPSLIESLRSALIDEGHKVTTANGGQAGIDAFRAAQRAGMPVDIVITDLAMPDVDGRQVVASLRALAPRTPIILLTGWQQHVANAGERSLQVDRLLGKPPRIRELRAVLAELTGRRASDRMG